MCVHVCVMKYYLVTKRNNAICSDMNELRYYTQGS